MATTLSTAEPNAVEADEANAGFVYYRCPNGEIVSGDWSGLEESKKMRLGYQALHEYGYHDFNSYYVEHPFEPLFQQGGAREMTVEQVVGNGFHLRPPLVPTCGRQAGRKGHMCHIARCWRGAQPVQFPQLEGLDLPGIQECGYCQQDHFPTPQALQQHVSVMHSDRKDQEAIVGGIVSGLRQAMDGRSAGTGGGLETLAGLLSDPAAVTVLRAVLQPDAHDSSTTPKVRRRRRARTQAQVSTASPVED